MMLEFLKIIAWIFAGFILAVIIFFRFTETYLEQEFKRIMKRFGGNMDEFFSEYPKKEKKKK